MSEPTGTTKIRTKNRPHEEIEVGPEELADLKALNLVYEGNATTDEGAVRAVETAAKRQAATENPKE